MVIFKSHKKLKLTKVATYERANEGKTYPEGSTIVQISATQGQVFYLHKDQPVESKYMVITPKDIEPFYLYIVIKKGMPKFVSRYQTGLNIQADAFKLMTIDVHTERATQDFIADQMQRLEKTEKNIEITIEKAQRFKRKMLQDMFV